MNFPNTTGTKCPKCESTNFEGVEDYPTNYSFKLTYIRCSACKTFLQALPCLDTNTLITIAQADIAKIKKKLLIFD